MPRKKFSSTLLVYFDIFLSYFSFISLTFHIIYNIWIVYIYICVCICVCAYVVTSYFYLLLLYSSIFFLVSFLFKSFCNVISKYVLRIYNAVIQYVPLLSSFFFYLCTIEVDPILSPFYSIWSHFLFILLYHITPKYILCIYIQYTYSYMYLLYV